MCKENQIYRKSRAGFSLIEILMAVGVMAIVSLAVSQLFINQMRQNKQINQRLEVTDLNNFILQIFQVQSICDVNFQGKKINISNLNNIPDLAIDEISSGLGQSIIKNNTAVSSSQTDLSVKSIKLTQLKNVGGAYYQGTLRVDFKDIPGYMTPRALGVNQLFETTSVTASEVSISSCVTPGKVVNVIVTNVNGGGGGGGGGNGGGGFSPPSASLSNIDCAANASCWIPLSFSGSPNMEVRATANCSDINGKSLVGTNNTLIGTINSSGSFQYTGIWDCALAPKSQCSQSYTVGGSSVGSHSWKCL